MNVLIVMGKNKVGMLRTVRGVDKHLIRKGYKFYYFLPEKKYLTELGFNEDRIKNIDNMTSLRKFPQSITAMVNVLKEYRTIKDWGIDVIYNYTLSTLPFCMLLSKLSGVPYVTAVRNVYKGDERHFKKYLLHRAKNILAVSKDTMSCVEKYLGVSKDRVNRFIAYNALDIEEFEKFSVSNIPEEYRHFSTDDIIVGMVSMQPEKNPQLLLRAGKHVVSRYPNVKFVFIGGFTDKDYERETLALTKDLSMDNNAFFLGGKNPVHPYFVHMDILVHPTNRKEPFGLVLIEAMSYGKPVIASRIGGIPEVIEDGVTGILCESEKEKEFADAIIKLIEDKELRRRMGEMGRERVRRMFSMDRLANDMDNIFRQVASQRVK